MIRKTGGLALVLLAGVSCAQAAIQLGEGRLEAEAVGMAGIATDPSLTALGLGVNGVYTRAYSENLNFGLGASLALPVLETNDDPAPTYGGSQLLGLEATNSGRSGLIFALNRLYADYRKADFGLMAGRFLLDSPFVHSSDGYRMIPNATEGVLATFYKPNMQLKAGYLNAFSGPSSASIDALGNTQRGSFVAMSDAALGEDAGGNANVDNMGLLTGAVLFQNETSGLNGQGWLYLMPTIDSAIGKSGLNILYGDIEKTMPMGAHAGKVAVQAWHMGFTEDGDALSHTVFGALLGITPSDRFSFEGAVNMVSGDGEVREPWGMGAGYAGGEEITLAGLQEGTALRVGGTLNLGDSDTLKKRELVANLLIQSGDAVMSVADADMQFVEGVFKGQLKEAIDAEARLVIGAGDAEGSVLYLRAAYRF